MSDAIALMTTSRLAKPYRAGELSPVEATRAALDRIRRRLPATVVRRLLYTVWRRVYRIARPMSDPAFRRMLRELSGRRWIGPLRLGVKSAPPSGH